MSVTIAILKSAFRPAEPGGADDQRRDGDDRDSDADLE